MRTPITMILGMLMLPLTSALAAPTYCPQRSGYIDIGMSEAEVINACGEPISKEPSKHVATHKVPVQQLYYDTLNPGSVYPGLNAAFYTQWSLPSASPASQSSLIIDIVDNKVRSFQVNGSNVNSLTMCQGMDIQIGDYVNKVYNACGSPRSINSTYINEPYPDSPKSVTWSYQSSEYQPPLRLTFVNGILQSID